MLSFDKVVVPAVLCGVIAVSVALSQNEGAPADGPRDRAPRAEGDRGDRGDRRGGDRPRFDPEQMRQRMTQMLKEQLKATDEEWTVLQPKIEKLQAAQRAARGGGMMGMGWRGRRDGGDGARGGAPAADDRPVSEVETTSRELRSALQEEATAAGEIASKLTAYRAARAKAQAELAAAREDLKSVLTQRQEAVLVLSGLLE